MVQNIYIALYPISFLIHPIEKAVVKEKNVYVTDFSS